jgi:hypothetical protein
VTAAAEPSPRCIRLVRPPGHDGVGVFAITAKKQTQFYAFKEVPCDIGGRAFAVHRLGLANLYHVRINTATDSTCECLGFLRHGRCKHVQGLAALIGHGLV